MTIAAIQIGLRPDVVGYGSPEFARVPGLTPEKLQAAHDGNIAQLRRAGFDVDGCQVDLGQTAVDVVRRAITGKRYDAVLIGAAIRLVSGNTLLFESVLNTVHEQLPAARFIFNQDAVTSATMARTLEVLDARGLADGLLALGRTAPAVSLFAGARLDLTRLRSRYPFVLVTPQTNVDQALGRYAVEQGADVRRDVEVTGLTQDATVVTVTARPKDDEDPGHQSTWRAAYVIGADGAHSTVRDLLGLAFPGRAVLSSVLLADVRLASGPAGMG